VASLSIKYPIGVLKDMPLQVGIFLIPCDLAMIEIEEDVKVLIILEICSS